jgi:hypothetical protein
LKDRLLRVDRPLTTPSHPSFSSFGLLDRLLRVDRPLPTPSHPSFSSFGLLVPQSMQQSMVVVDRLLRVERLQQHYLAHLLLVLLMNRSQTRRHRFARVGQLLAFEPMHHL